MTNAMNALIKENQSNDCKKDPSIKMEDSEQVEYKQSVKSQMLDIVLIATFFLGILMMFTAPSFNSKNTLSTSWDLKLARGGGNLYDTQKITPEQLHLSLGADSSEMYVTWSTLEPISNAALIYCEASVSGGCSRPEDRIPAIRTDTKVTEKDANWVRVTRRRSRVIHTYRAKITGLEDAKLYIYRAESRISPDIVFFSRTYQFVARDFSGGRRKSYNLALFGDLGLVNGRSVPRMILDVDKGEYDLMIHNGDFAYDMNTHHGQYGDEFMRLIEPIAARVPYQVSVGNHEIAQNFSHYDSRFTMINGGSMNRGEQNNFYYSFNVGPVHFVAFSTEFYYFLDRVGMPSLQHQYEWLKRDLEHASSPSERAKRPWIIVFGHRPMYCSSRDHDDCSKDTNILRKGLPKTGAYALEKLFYNYGVDVELYSHEHQYERFLPIYDGKIYNGTENTSNPYQNPLAPVHIISGSAGCQERLDPFNDKPATGSVKQVSDYGYTRLRASCSKLRFEQISDDLGGSIQDEFELIKTQQNFPTKSDDTFDCDYSESIWDRTSSWDHWWLNDPSNQRDYRNNI